MKVNSKSQQLLALRQKLHKVVVGNSEELSEMEYKDHKQEEEEMQVTKKQFKLKENTIGNKLPPKKFLPVCPGCKNLFQDGMKLLIHFKLCLAFKEWFQKKQNDPWKSNDDNNIEMKHVVLKTYKNPPRFVPHKIVRYK